MNTFEMFETNQVIEMKDELFYGLTGKQTIYLLTGLCAGLAIFNTTMPLVAKAFIGVNVGIPTAIFTKTDIDQGIKEFLQFTWRTVTKKNVSIQPLSENKLSSFNKGRTKTTKTKIQASAQFAK